MPKTTKTRSSATAGNTSNIGAEIQRLRNEIRHHDRKYYVEAAPEITDLDYDKLLSQLKQLEQENPDLVTPDSPTQRVGDQPIDALRSVKHRVPMLSIDNTYSADELKQYFQRVAKLLPGERIQWVVELKVDGVAVALTYEDGVLSQAATRGNGVAGDDITHNVRTVQDVPLKLLGDDVPPVVEVRGEIYMTNSQLVQLNQEQQARGEPPFANTRNVAAGTIRMLDPRICAARKLRMYVHGVGYSEGFAAQTHMELLAAVQRFGLSGTPFVNCCASTDEVLAYSEEMVERLHELDFEVDGLVIKVNRFDQRQRLGSTSKSPRWIVAYKFEKYEAVTKLNAIRVQVGKTGAITPVAELEPVELAGTTVSRASLHNADEVERKDVRVGDVVVVEKAGKIIPHIVRAEHHLRKEELPKFQFPKRCPECDTPLVKDEGGVYIRCPNWKCPAQVKERVRYYASRNAMDIGGLGDKLVDQLVGDKLVTTVGDLYRLKLDQLIDLERMGKKSSENLLAQIETSKSRGLSRLLNALAMRHVGNRIATILAQHFGSMEALQAATAEQLGEVHEIGPTIAKSVYEFLHSEHGQAMLKDLQTVGVQMKEDRPAPTGGVFAGKTIVVTGTLAHYGREEIEELITRHGGRAASSVSSKTDFVVAGEKAGSKLAKAQELGIPVYTEEQFREMVK